MKGGSFRFQLGSILPPLRSVTRFLPSFLSSLPHHLIPIVARCTDVSFLHLHHTSQGSLPNALLLVPRVPDLPPLEHLVFVRAFFVVGWFFPSYGFVLGFERDVYLGGSGHDLQSNPDRTGWDASTVRSPRGIDPTHSRLVACAMAHPHDVRPPPGASSKHGSGRKETRAKQGRDRMRNRMEMEGERWPGVRVDEKDADTWICHDGNVHVRVYDASDARVAVEQACDRRKSERHPQMPCNGCTSATPTGTSQKAPCHPECRRSNPKRKRIEDKRT